MSATTPQRSSPNLLALGDSDEKSRELEKLRQGSHPFAGYHADSVRLTTILLTFVTAGVLLRRLLSGDPLNDVEPHDLVCSAKMRIEGMEGIPVSSIKMRTKEAEGISPSRGPIPGPEIRFQR